jgi:putative hydroxymethylpyrimidine transport system substrate-binding protein
MKPKCRSLTILATLLATALAAAGCGQVKPTYKPAKGSVQSLSLMLDWLPNADHSGLYEALAKGYFRQAALDVHVEIPSNPSEPLQLLAAGKIDAAISYEPNVMLARNAGTPLVSVAAIVQRPLTSIISVGSQHITTPARLRGKTIGTAGIAYQSAYLQTILAHAHVPRRSVHVIDVGFNLVPAMLSGHVNATLGGYWNYEAIELRQDGRHPNVIPVNDAGVPTYDELVLVVRKSTIINDTNMIRRFVQALARGYAAVRANPVGAARTLVAANPSLSSSYRLELASIRATLPAYFPSGGHPWGWQSAAQWNAFGAWMLHNHLISNPLAVEDASTNELLAGQGI